MLPITCRARAWLGALAFSGAVGGHILAYAFIAPDPHARAELLQGTGHGPWPVVVAIALAALVAGCAGCLRDGAARLRGSPTGQSLYASTALRLGALQMASFLILETAERTLVHGHIHAVLGEPAVAVGMVVQVATALIGAALLVLFARVVDHFRARRPSIASRTESWLPLRHPRANGRRLVFGCAEPRGPPSPPHLPV